MRTARSDEACPRGSARLPSLPAQRPRCSKPLCTLLFFPFPETACGEEARSQASAALRAASFSKLLRAFPPSRGS
jgi:hypothetical protein